MKRFLAVVALLFLVLGTADAQKVAVKTNSLYWLTTTPNAGFEFALGDRWTFEIAGGYNPWTLNIRLCRSARFWRPDRKAGAWRFPGSTGRSSIRWQRPGRSSTTGSKCCGNPAFWKKRCLRKSFVSFYSVYRSVGTSNL